jgi:hypothetical protein
VAMVRGLAVASEETTQTAIVAAHAHRHLMLI